METNIIKDVNTEERKEKLKLSDFVEKEVEMNYFDDFNFDENNNENSFQSSCRRISYCSCNCHRCNVVTI